MEGGYAAVTRTMAVPRATVPISMDERDNVMVRWPVLTHVARVATYENTQAPATEFGNTNPKKRSERLSPRRLTLGHQSITSQVSLSECQEVPGPWVREPAAGWTWIL